MLRILGKRFADAGLRDLLVEAGVVAQGSVSSVLEGRHYNRGVRAHKIVYEALMRLVWTQFCEHVVSTFEDASRILLTEAIRHIASLSEDLSEKQVISLIESESLQFLFDQLRKYMDCLRFSSGPLSAFWMSYIDMVSLMLDTIRASREGNWNLHMACIRSLIPWCFAYDHCNYARYLPVYYAQMTSLHDHFPDVQLQFESGAFSVQLSDLNTFGRIPVDQTIEETINKDTKTPGGIKGFSRNFAAVKRHFINAETKSGCLKQLRILTKVTQPGLSHPDLTSARIKCDERDVQKIMDLLLNSWIMPFSDVNSDLVSLSSGKRAPSKVSDNLLRAIELGETAYSKFKSERLEVSADVANKITGKSKFHEPLIRLRLQTFASCTESKTVKSHDRNIILQGDKNLFGKMVLISQTRRLDMSEVFSHPLGPVPYELANADGSIRKNNKSSLGREVMKNATLITSIPNPSAYIIDGMALVHRLPPNLSTFGDAAEALLRMAIRDSGESDRVDIVFDVYRQLSVKEGERERRKTKTSLQYSNIQSGHKVQQWNKFISSSSNKVQFLRFIAAEWELASHRQRLLNMDYD